MYFSDMLVVLFTLLLRVCSSSVITTYSDAKCQKSFNNLDVVNGYPDGVCTPLDISQTGSMPQTFQIAKLDEGCAVTLYGPNEGALTCSSSIKIVAEFGTCYNASWIYYSVDNCLTPKPSSIILPTTQPTSTPPSALAQSSAQNSPSHTGAIAGGVSGGIAGIAIVFGVVFFLRRRKRRLDRGGGAEKPLPLQSSYELSNEQQVIEAGRRSFMQEKAPMEVFGDEAGVEMGRNSATIYRAELAGDSGIGDGKYVHAGKRDERRG